MSSSKEIRKETEMDQVRSKICQIANDLVSVKTQIQHENGFGERKVKLSKYVKQSSDQNDLTDADIEHFLKVAPHV